MGKGAGWMGRGAEVFCGGLDVGRLCSAGVVDNGSVVCGYLVGECVVISEGLFVWLTVDP